MKKIMKLFVLVAAAAMALASCQKNEVSGPVNKEVHFTIKAEIADTKTTITDNGDQTYTPKWESGDKIGVLFTLEASAAKVEFENTASAGETATFEGKNTFATNDEGTVEGNMYAFYPSSAFEKVYTGGEIRLNLKATQSPTSTSFDPSCDLLIAKPCYYMAEATGGQVEVVIANMYFARMMSVLRINLNSEFLSNETVKSVSFDADGVDFTGAMRFNLETGAFVGNQSTTQDLSEVKAIYSEEDPIAVAGEKNSAYLVVAPVTIPAGTTLTFTIETENYDIVKTIAAPADMEMPAGNIAVINLTIAEENCTAKSDDTSDYSGTYIIVAEKSDTYYYMSTKKDGADSGNNRTAISSGVSEITDYTSSKTDFSDVDETCVWSVAKVDGGYTFANMDNTKYLYTTDENRAMMGAEENASIFTIVVEDNIYTITDKTYSRTLSLNSTSDLFACYKSGQIPELILIPYVADTTPKIIVADEDLTQSVDAEATELTFNYQVKNITGTPTVTVASEPVPTMTNVSATAADGVVTVKFDANTAETAKSATITLSYEGATSVNVVINQAAKAAEGESGWIATAFADLKAGDQVVIVSTKDSETWALSNENGTSAAPTGVTGVTYVNNKLSAEPGANIVWSVGVDGDKRIFYADSDKSSWLYCTSTNNGVRVGTNTNNLFSYTDNYLYNVSTSRYVGVYITNPDWRCYTSINDNITGQTFQFFVKSGDSSGEEGDETPVDPVQLTMSDITCSAQTENSLTFTWPAVANASKYEVTFNNGTAEEVTTTSYTATGLETSTSYTISVKAVGDGTNYTTSEAKTQTGLTTAASSGGETQSITETLTVGTNGDCTWSNGEKTASATVNSVNFIALGDGGNDSKYYSSDNTWRFYTQNTSGVQVEVPSSCSITEVVITVDKGVPSTPDGCNMSSASKVYTFTVSSSVTTLSFYKNTSDNLEIKSISVTYNN